MAGSTAVISLLATSGHTPVVPFVAGAVGVVLVLGTSGYRHARTAERRWLLRGAVLTVIVCGAASAAAALGVLGKGSMLDAGTVELRGSGRRPVR